VSELAESVPSVSSCESSSLASRAVCVAVEIGNAESGASLAIPPLAVWLKSTRSVQTGVISGVSVGNLISDILCGDYSIIPNIEWDVSICSDYYDLLPEGSQDIVSAHIL